MSFMTTTTYLQRSTRPVPVVKANQNFQNCSVEIDGLRLLSNENNSFGLRMLWLVVILGATIACGFQAAERIAYYSSNPSIVKVCFLQNNTFKPPAVVICPYCVRYFPGWNSHLVSKQFGGNVSANHLLKWLDIGNISLTQIWNVSKMNLPSISLINNNNVEDSSKKQDITITEVNTSVGTCHQIKFKTELKQFIARPRFVFEIIQEPTHPRCVTVSLNVPDESAIDEYFYYPKGVPNKGVNLDLKYVIRVTESVFRNTSKNPCGDSEYVSNCLSRCMENVFIPKETKVLCRFPFMRHFNVITPCRTKMELDRMSGAIRAATLKFDPAQCSCWRKCRELIYILDYISIKKPFDHVGWWLEINIPDGKLTMIKEEAAYSGYEAFADLGGCLSLWLGLCFLELLEIGTFTSSNLFLAIRKFISSKNARKQIITGRRYRVAVIRTEHVKTMFTPTVELPGFRQAFKQQTVRRNRFLWFSVALITLFLFIHQSVDLLALYFTDPSTTRVYYTNDITVPFPSIMVCFNRSDGRRPALSAKLIQEKLGISHGYKEVLDLMSKGQLTVYDAWNMSGFTFKYMNSSTSDDDEWISSVVPTILGNCLTFQPKEEINYKGLPPNQVLHISTNDEPGTKLIMIYPQEDLDLVKYFQLVDFTELEFYNHSWTIKTAFRTTQVSHRNSKQTPCLDHKQEVRCIVECLEKKIALKTSHEYCRLPFMVTMASTCSSTTAMDTVMNAALRMIHTFNTEDCLCFKPCKEYVYNKEYFTTDVTYGECGILSVQMQVWNKEIMVMEEVQSYNVFALFSDLGGSMGLFSGICVINLLEIVQFAFWKLLIFVKSQFLLNKTKRIGPLVQHRWISVVETSAETKDHEHRTLTYTRPTEDELPIPMWNRILWFSICVGMLCPFMYLSLERIQYYNSDPSSSSTYYAYNKTIRFPIMVICPKTEYSLYGDHTDETKFLDYWNMSTYQPIMQRVQVNGKTLLNTQHLVRPHITFSLKATTAGVFLMLIPKKPVNYNGHPTSIGMFFYESSAIKNCWMTVFPQEKLPLVRYLKPDDCYFAKGYPTMHIRLKMQITEVFHRNTSNIPCKDGQIVSSCLVTCIERNIYNQLTVKCRLPFMQESKAYGLCRTKEEYLAVKNATLNVIDNFNQTDCKCGRECKKTIYSVDDLKFKTDDTVHFILRIRDASFPVIREEAAYTFIKLLSDLGGSLGLFFGLGLLQLGEMLAITVAKVKNLLKIV